MAFKQVMLMCWKRVLMVALATAGIVGCEVGPNYKAPEVTMPASFDLGPQLLPTTMPVSKTAAGAATQATMPQGSSVAAATRPVKVMASATPIDLQRWWEALGDAELDRLVTQAVAANFDVGAAVARVQEARAQFSAATGAEFPLLDATAGAGRGSGTNNTKNRIGGPLNAGTNTGGLEQLNYVAGFDAAWEVDLFGRLRREAEAAKADADAAAENRNQVLVTVISEVARNYISVRSNQLRLKITQENIEALKRTAELTRVMVRRGLGNELNVVLAERQVSAALARVAPLDAEIKRAQREIAVLLGKNPEELYAELDGPPAGAGGAGIPALVEELDAGVPAQLLRRRPDVRRAERQLAAASARIGVATADLFPSLSLTGGVGVQGQGLGVSPPHDLLDWSVGPAFRMPLLDFGRLDALVQVQDFRTQQVLLGYRKAVVSAVAEVENALASYAAERNRLEQLTVAVDSSQQAVNLATQRFNRGLTDFLNVLDAQRQLYALEDEVAASRQTVSTQLIGVFKALGGGWEGMGTVPANPKLRPAILAELQGRTASAR